MSNDLIKPCGICGSALKLERKIARIVKKLHDRPNGHKFVTVWDLEEYFNSELKKVKK